MKSIKIALILAAAAIFAAACGQTATVPNKPANVAAVNKPGETTTAKTPAAVGEAANGKELYALNCMICHKDTGKGGKVTIEGKNLKPDDLTSEKIKSRTDDKLVAQITAGVPDEGMPSFEPKLTEDEIRAVVKHVRTLQ